MDEERRRWFAQQVERLTDRLYGTALRLTRNAEDAEDLVADTVVKAWAKLGELRDPQAFEAWIRRILNNSFVSAWRHRRASPEVADSMACEDDPDESFSLFEKLHQPFLLWWGNPEETAITNLLREDIERALDALPDAHRVVVVLVDVEGCSYPEAAETLGVPVGTVRSRLNRARGQLQRALWKHAQEAGFTKGEGGDDAQPQP
jgi:RNA polymerase sigma-70 factor (ECF subfamily)